MVLIWPTHFGFNGWEGRGVRVFGVWLPFLPIL